MSGKQQVLKRLLWTRFLSAFICLCAFTYSPFSQLTTTAWAETAERECPCQNDGETAEEDFAVCDVTCRRGDYRLLNHLSRPIDKGNRLCRVAAAGGRCPAVDGHQFANGSRAPLRI